MWLSGVFANELLMRRNREKNKTIDAKHFGVAVQGSINCVNNNNVHFPYVKALKSHATKLKVENKKVFNFSKVYYFVTINTY